MRNFTGSISIEPRRNGFRIVLAQPTGEKIYRDLTAAEAADLQRQLAAGPEVRA